MKAESCWDVTCQGTSLGCSLLCWCGVHLVGVGLLPLDVPVWILVFPSFQRLLYLLIVCSGCEKHLTCGCIIGCPEISSIEHPKGFLEGPPNNVTLQNDLKLSDALRNPSKTKNWARFWRIHGLEEAAQGARLFLYICACVAHLKICIYIYRDHNMYTHRHTYLYICKYIYIILYYIILHFIVLYFIILYYITIYIYRYYKYIYILVF